MNRLLTLVLVLSLSVPLLGQESPSRIEDLGAELDRLRVERDALSKNLSELEIKIRQLEAQRDQILYEESAKDGVFVVTSMDAPFKKEPSAYAEIMREIPKGVQLPAMGYRKYFWKVYYDGKVGYVPEFWVVRNDQAKDYFETRGSDDEFFHGEYRKPSAGAGEQNPGPTSGSGMPPLTGVVTQEGSSSRTGATSSRAAVQCSAYTKKGGRCKRMTTSPSGRCWQH